MKDEDKNKEVDMQRISKIIKKTAEEAIKGTIEELKSENLIKNDINYYRRVETILYNYKTLVDAVKQKEEDIKDIEEHGLPEASKSIIIYSTSNGGISAEERFIQLKAKYKLEQVETQRDINRIERALDKIREDKYFDIIKIKYLEREENGEKNISDEYIAEVLGKDRTTISRNRKRLMRQLEYTLFPESLRSIM